MTDEQDAVDGRAGVPSWRVIADRISAEHRAADDGPIDEAALSRAPAPLRSPERPLRLDLATATLGTAVYEKPRPGTHGHDGTWSVPLPVSRLQSAGVSP